MGTDEVWGRVGNTHKHRTWGFTLQQHSSDCSVVLSRNSLCELPVPSALWWLWSWGLQALGCLFYPTADAQDWRGQSTHTRGKWRRKPWPNEQGGDWTVPEYLTTETGLRRLYKYNGRRGSLFTRYWTSEFNPQDQHGWRKELTPKSCPLTVKHELWHAHAYHTCITSAFYHRLILNSGCISEEELSKNWVVRQERLPTSLYQDS